jgi:hypothetical protein
MKFLTPIIFSISLAVAPVFANETVTSKEGPFRPGYNILVFVTYMYMNVCLGHTKR